MLRVVDGRLNQKHMLKITHQQTTTDAVFAESKARTGLSLYIPVQQLQHKFADETRIDEADQLLIFLDAVCLWVDLPFSFKKRHELFKCVMMVLGSL